MLENKHVGASSSLTFAIGAALIAVSGNAAAATIGSTTPVATYNCAAPSVTLCKDTAFLNQCRTETVSNYCKPILNDELLRGSVQDLSLYHPNQNKLLRNLASGKARPYQYRAPSRSWAEILVDFADPSVSKMERRARSAAWALPSDPAAASSWTRNADWDANGNRLESCEEYVYESFYSYERFLDSAYRCQQDASCIADQANEGVTRIRSRWGDLAPTGSGSVFFSGILPKNMFTTEAAVAFLPNVVLDQFSSTPHHARLSAARESMYQERYRYGVATTGAISSYASELDWHIAMRDAQRHQNVSEAERVQLRKRQQDLSRKMRDFAQRYMSSYIGTDVVIDIDETGHVHRPDNSILPAEHSKEMPLDSMVDRAFVNLIGSVPQTANSIALNSDSDYFTIQRDTVYRNLTSDLGPRSDAESNAFRYFSNGSTLGQRTLGAAVAQALASVTITRDTSSSQLALRCPSATAGWVASSMLQQMGEDACQIANLILAEGSREWLLGDRGCLTTGFNGCDWAPEEFVDHFVTKQVVTKERDDLFKKCQKYTLDFAQSDTFIPVKADGTSVGTISFGSAKSNGARMWPFLANAETAIRNTVAAIPRSPNGFGQSLRSSELIGDKALFAGGYSGSMGWNIELIRQNGQLCRMNTDMHGDLDINVYIFNDQSNIVDAHALASIINGNGHAEAHLNVMDYPVFTPVNRTINLNGVLNELWNEREDDRTELARMTFTAGPIPVTIAAGASWFYGANFSTQLRAPTSCVPNQNQTTLATLLESSTTFEPFAGVNAWASLGAGVPGLLSVEINADLNLIQASVPTFSNIRVGIAPNAMGYPNVVALTLDAGAKLNYSTLSGDVDLIFEALLIPVKIDLFDWKGIQGQATLVKNPAITVPLLLIPPSTAS